MVFRFPFHGSGTGDCRDRILQVTGGVGRTAGFTAITILIRAAAAGTLAPNEPVWQEYIGVWIIGLSDDSFGNVAGCIETIVNCLRKIAVFLRMGSVIEIELNMNSREITLMITEDLFNQLSRFNTIRSCFEHDGRTVRIIGTNITRIMSDEFLEADPGICLNHLEHMTEVNWAIRVR